MLKQPLIVVVGGAEGGSVVAPVAILLRVVVHWHVVVAC